jgi:ADP-ribosylglycohydrolase
MQAQLLKVGAKRLLPTLHEEINMLGSIIGDLAGSRFEGSSQNLADDPLFIPHLTTFTDDTVCTIAVADALVNNLPIEDSLRSWCKRYPARGYGSRFKKWINSPVGAQHDSYGNGAAMRIAPAGLLATDQHVIDHIVPQITNVSHDHPEARRGAHALATGIHLAIKGIEKSQIKNELMCIHGYDLIPSVQDLHDRNIYSESCQDTVPIALVCALKASCFEEAIRNAIYIGGDTDTISCMTGGLAEALYGIPDSLANTGLEYLPVPMLEVLSSLYRTAGQPMPLPVHKNVHPPFFAGHKLVKWLKSIDSKSAGRSS